MSVVWCLLSGVSLMFVLFVGEMCGAVPGSVHCTSVYLPSSHSDREYDIYHYLTSTSLY